MNERRWLLTFGAGLILLSVALYALHFLIFHDIHHIGIYTLGDIAFLPLEVLLVTLVFHQVLESRDRRQRMEINEELQRRPGFSGLPVTDMAHLAGDLERVYTLLIREWLDYMRYLQKNYPYLFSFAMRTNPFDEMASAIVE